MSEIIILGVIITGGIIYLATMKKGSKEVEHTFLGEETGEENMSPIIDAVQRIVSATTGKNTTGDDNNYISDILKKANIPEQYVSSSTLESIADNYDSARKTHNSVPEAQDLRLQGLQTIVDYVLTDGEMDVDVRETSDFRVGQFFDKKRKSKKKFFKGYSASRKVLEDTIKDYVTGLVENIEEGDNVTKLKEFTNLVYAFSKSLISHNEDLLEIIKNYSREREYTPILRLPK